MIHCVWHEGAFPGYGHMALFHEMLAHYKTLAHNSPATVPDGQGCVMVVHGGNEKHLVPQLNVEIQRFPWLVLVVCGDEGAEFPLELVEHPNMLVWLQMPALRHGVSVRVDRFMPFSYQGDAKGYADPHTDKDLDWFFAGQLTHSRRHDCAKALEAIPNGILRGSQGFGQGLPHDEYWSYLNRARIAPCPSGPATPETFRMFEALEAGCIPIVDGRTPSGGGKGYFRKVYGNDFPIPIIDDWAQLPAYMGLILPKFREGQPIIARWWQEYKRKFNGWLEEDLRSLGAI